MYWTLSFRLLHTPTPVLSIMTTPFCVVSCLVFSILSLAVGFNLNYITSFSHYVQVHLWYVLSRVVHVLFLFGFGCVLPMTTLHPGVLADRLCIRQIPATFITRSSRFSTDIDCSPPGICTSWHREPATLPCT